jgi:hypothetical protein
MSIFVIFHKAFKSLSQKDGLSYLKVFGCENYYLYNIFQLCTGKDTSSLSSVQIDDNCLTSFYLINDSFNYGGPVHKAVLY